MDIEQIFRMWLGMSGFSKGVVCKFSSESHDVTSLSELNRFSVVMAGYRPHRLFDFCLFAWLLLLFETGFL